MGYLIENKQINLTNFLFVLGHGGNIRLAVLLYLQLQLWSVRLVMI